MPRGQLPKAYLRLDPDIDAKHPELLAEFIRLLCAANRQPHRGYFRSRTAIEALLGKPATKRLVERGDVTEEDGEWCVGGWDHWQEGNLDVAERMRRIRSERENKPRTNRAHSEHKERTEGAPKVAPTPKATRQQGVFYEDTPETPNPYDADDIEVLADGLLRHPATPGQLQAVRTLGRKLTKGRAEEVMRYWLTEGNADDPFGAALDQMGSEASQSKKRSRSKFAYMDESNESNESKPAA